VIGPVSQWEQTLTAALPRVKLERAPGVSFSYSNVGYAILGAAMSHAVGEPYTRYVSENIFAPLHMTHTAFEPTAEMAAVLARGYVVEKGVADPSIPDAELKSGRGYKVPNGAIFTTIDDLATFVSFEMGEGPESVLPHDVLKANYQRAFPISRRANTGSYGVGFFKQLVGGHVIIGHSGAVAGYTASAFFNPDAKIGVVCLTSYMVSCDPAAIKALVALLGGAPTTRD
jgi:D-alanyl-D-alanine carboxypeptidase